MILDARLRRHDTGAHIARVSGLVVCRIEELHDIVERDGALNDLEALDLVTYRLGDSAQLKLIAEDRNLAGPEHHLLEPRERHLACRRIHPWPSPSTVHGFFGVEPRG